MKTKTRVVNIRKEPFDIYIGRPGSKPPWATAKLWTSQGTMPHVFGNPFPVKAYGREGCIEKFREYFLERVEVDQEFRERVLALKGKTLGCFCKPSACHGDVIAEWLDK